MNFENRVAQFIGQDVEIFNGSHYIEGELKGVNRELLVVQTMSPGYSPEPQIAHVVTRKIGYIRIFSTSS